MWEDYIHETSGSSADEEITVSGHSRLLNFRLYDRMVFIIFLFIFVYLFVNREEVLVQKPFSTPSQAEIGTVQSHTEQIKHSVNQKIEVNINVPFKGITFPPPTF